MLYSKEKGKFLSPDNENELAFSEAIFSGMLDSSLIRVLDTKDGTVHELDTALQKGLINISSGSCVDALSGNVLSLLDSIEGGILIVETASLNVIHFWSEHLYFPVLKSIMFSAIAPSRVTND
jgi:hypothetical protein